MSEEQCNHVVWLERIVPQYTDSPHWLAHDFKDGNPPSELASDDIIFHFCPLCGANLKNK
jgi:hypothetical protein